MPALSGKERFKLTLEQTFQEIEGRAFQGSSRIPLRIKDEKIKGSEFEFSLEVKIQGRRERLFFLAAVSGDRMEGRVHAEGKSAEKELWQAKRAPKTKTSIEK